DREGELTERPRITRELDVTAGENVPCLVVPHRHGCPFGEPQPTEAPPPPVPPRPASHSQLRPSSAEMSWLRKVSTARLRAGVPAAYPSVTSSARPSRSKSGGRAGAGGAGAIRAALAPSPPAGDRRPTNSAAVNAS